MARSAAGRTRRTGRRIFLLAECSFGHESEALRGEIDRFLGQIKAA
jgi:hypothetical protein